MNMKSAQLQTKVLPDKRENIRQLDERMDAIKGERPDMVTVGEMFTCPYDTANFPVYAEEQGGESWQALSSLAKKYRVYLSAGSVAERDGQDYVYNTAYVFDRQGNQIARHRKMHLFDISVEGGQSFRESDTLTPGDEYTVFDTEFGKMGICVCFDCRFPELSRLMVIHGAKVILVPAAFNMTTRPAHWEIMFRQRAVDNQCFMVGTSVARDEKAGYRAWATPWQCPPGGM